MEGLLNKSGLKVGQTAAGAAAPTSDAEYATRPAAREGGGGGKR